jgi:NADPH:quinone reductase-like Zn-dependent oxidoreductase
VELVRSLGADRVIDYTQENFAEGGELYDVIFDAVGKIPKSDRKKALAPDGTFITVSSSEIAKETTENMVFLKDFMQAEGVKPVIDRSYPLEQIAEAHRYVDTGRKKGNVVITVGHNGSG